MRMTPVSDMTYMNLGESVQIVIPARRAKEKRNGGMEGRIKLGSVSDRRHEKLLSEKDGVIRMLEGHEGYRKIIDMISENRGRGVWDAMLQSRIS